MAAMGREIRITHQEGPLFLTDAPIMVDGQPSTSCWQQVLGPAAHMEAGEDEACSTSCMRQLRLPHGFMQVG